MLPHWFTDFSAVPSACSRKPSIHSRNPVLLPAVLSPLPLHCPPLGGEFTKSISFILPGGTCLCAQEGEMTELWSKERAGAPRVFLFFLLPSFLLHSHTPQRVHEGRRQSDGQRCLCFASVALHLFFCVLSLPPFFSYPSFFGLLFFLVFLDWLKRTRAALSWRLETVPRAQRCLWMVCVCRGLQ